MPMRQQDMIQALKANSGFQNLALGAFAAVNHKAVLAVFDHQ